MREVGSWVEVSEGCWVLKPEVAPAFQEKAKPAKSREYVASVLAPLGIAVNTSRPTPVEVAEERERKQQEHEQSRSDRERERQDREQAEAKSDCEAMVALLGPGQLDRTFMDLLRQVIARDTVTGEVDWVQTKIERNKCLEAHQRVVADGARFKIGG